MKKKSRESIKIDKNMIIVTAIQLLQEDGIEKLSIRNVAERLNIKGASLYWHIKNKDELLEFIADEICKKVIYPEKSISWENQLIELSYQFRKILLNIRDSAHILAETAPKTEHRLRLIKEISDLFERVGMKSEDIFSSSWILNNYIMSFVIEEYRFRQFTNEEGSAPLVDELPFDIASMNMDREFQFGLEILIAGFKSKAT